MNLDEIRKWRHEQETRLRSETGWLTVVGLEWLQAGENPIGSGAENRVHLPKSAPETLGSILLEDDKTRIRFAKVDGVTLEGRSIEENQIYDLDEHVEVKIGSITFFRITRKNGVGIRVRDSQAEARKNFHGRVWFEPQSDFVVEARWQELEEKKILKVPDILGNENDEIAAGRASFTIEGKACELYPIRQGDSLFFVFKDQTSGKETYGAGRFLYTGFPENGKLTLDFNRAVNPPCAFTDFATCPIPAKENRLAVAIAAGELKPPGHD